MRGGCSDAYRHTAEEHLANIRLCESQVKIFIAYPDTEHTHVVFSLASSITASGRW